MTASSAADGLLDRLQKLSRGDMPPPPIAALIDFKLASIKSGQAVIDFEATKRHVNPMERV